MSGHHRFPVFIYVIIGLAFFGLAVQLFTNPTNLLSSALIIIGSATLIYTVVYFLFLRKRTTDDLKKYRKAVKQSKKRYGFQNNYMNKSTKTKKTTPILSRKKRQTDKSTSHLRVIDGKKTKKNDRVSF